jgi:23S rRNA (cytosine1962-C5)-methyltransferase
MDSTITISARGEERVQSGHFWIYRSDVAAGSGSQGEVVRVAGPRGRFLGQAFFSDRSQITLRMLTRHDTPIDRAFWRRRIEEAVRFRDRLGIDATAWRLLHGEGDLIPSLVVDRYADYLVIQALSQGTDRLQDQFVEILVDLLQPAGVLARNDPRVRLLEGLEQRVDVLHGNVPDKVTVRETEIEYDVDLRGGQKTGAFLDQRENRLAAAAYAHGRVLDCFSYAGGFALQLARRAAEVTALDISEDATAMLARNAARNHLANLSVRTTNVFDELRALERVGEKFDTIVLDPPAFAKTRMRSRRPRRATRRSICAR